jgi:alpha-methylacyl-CoA racemase
MGPLAGVRIVEFAGIGPAPMAAMLLADMGATVLRLDRTEPSGLGLAKPVRYDLIMRGRQSLRVDLKHSSGLALAQRLVNGADALIEGFRPGTMERLGLGPDVLLKTNPRLIYGRMTGFGQSGPLAKAAGHDLNYIALTGALHAIGRDGHKPTPPLNLLGDFAGGSLYLAFGLVCALLEARASGQGQVVDAAIVDGTANLMTMIYGLNQAGLHSTERGRNLLDSGSPIYDVYACADGKFVSVAPIERKFRDELLRRLEIESGLDDSKLRGRLEQTFRSRTRDEWCARLEGSDACFAPVLSMDEAPNHPHNRERSAFIEIDGVTQPAPAPRFSRTHPAVPLSPERPGASGRSALWSWGVSDSEIERLSEEGAILLLSEDEQTPSPQLQEAGVGAACGKGIAKGG